MQTSAAWVMEWVIIVFIAGLGAVVLFKVFTGSIDLSHVLDEMADTPVAGVPPSQPKASLSRLQMLVFTFVIAGLYLTLCLEAGEFLAIPDQVLGLLGISGGSYVISKGIQANKTPAKPQ
jgi:hypothetical protein